MSKEAMGRLILEASTGMHGDVAKQLADAWAAMAEKVVQQDAKAQPKSTASWRPAPAEPTPEMEEAGERAVLAAQGKSWADTCGSVYRAMLAAAPAQAPAPAVASPAEGDAVALPAPRLYCHELIENKQLNPTLADMDGIWIGCNDLAVLKQSHTPGETGDEILALYTAEQVQAIVRAALANVQPKGTQADAWQCAICGAVSEVSGTTPDDNWCSSCGAGGHMEPRFAAQSPAPAHVAPRLTAAEYQAAWEAARESWLRRTDAPKPWCALSFAEQVELVVEEANRAAAQSPAVVDGKEQPTYAQIRMRAELLGRQRLRTDAEVHCLAERAGFKWIEADGDEDGFPGGFDMSDFKHMRRLVDSLTVDCQSCNGSGEEECGDPETGSVIENCGSCNGTGRAGFGEAQPPVQHTGGA